MASRSFKISQNYKKFFGQRKYKQNVLENNNNQTPQKPSEKKEEKKTDSLFNDEFNINENGEIVPNDDQNDDHQTNDPVQTTQYQNLPEHVKQLLGRVPSVERRVGSLAMKKRNDVSFM